jgi:hypothetical protein
MDTTAKRARIAAATEKTLVAIGAPVDRELLRYGAETQMADALALLAEDYAKLIARVEALEAKLKRKD